jgi:hypothetical protein
MTDNIFDTTLGAPGDQQQGSGNVFEQQLGAAQRSQPQQQQQPVLPQHSMWASKAGRLIQGMGEPILGTAQLASHLTGVGTDYIDKKAALAQQMNQESRQQAGLGKEDWDLWRGAGNVASPINYVPGAAIERIAGPAATLTGLAGRSAAAGAAYNVMQPVTDLKPGESFAERKGEEAATGAGMGAIAGPAAKSIAGVISPNVSEAVRALDREGVKPTIGSVLGGPFKGAEDALSTVMVVGGPIQAAKREAVESFVKAGANRALEPIGEKIPEELSRGHDVVAHVENAISKKYDEIHPQLSVSSHDPRFESDLRGVMDEAAALPEAQANQLQKIIETQITNKFKSNNGVMDGRTIQSVTSELGRRQVGYLSDPSFDTRDLGRAIGGVRSAFSAMLERQNPELAQPLRDANTAWGRYTILRDAANSTAANEGAFSAKQLQRASRAADKTVGKGATAKGEAYYQDLAENAQQVLPASIGSSGTAERGAALALLGGHTAISPQTAALSAVIPVLYSRPVSELIRRAVLDRPEGAEYVANMLRRYSPMASAGPAALQNQNIPQPQQQRPMYTPQATPTPQPQTGPIDTLNQYAPFTASLVSLALNNGQ